MSKKFKITNLVNLHLRLISYFYSILCTLSLFPLGKSAQVFFIPGHCELLVLTSSGRMIQITKLYLPTLYDGKLDCICCPVLQDS